MNEWTEEAIAALVRKNAEVQAEYQTGQEKVGRMDDAWTQTEIAFATEHLEPRLEAGVSLAWWPQPKFRLPFMTYTPDFAEITSMGILFFYEVKGSYRLGSAGRSSVALRAFSHFSQGTGTIVYRATRTDDGWKMENIEDKREKGPHTRAKVVEDEVD